MNATNNNPLASLHSQLVEIADRYATDTVKVTVYFGSKAQLLIDAKRVGDVREVLDRFIVAAGALRAELPGRKLGIAKSHGYRVWNLHDDSGYCVGKRAAVTIEMTEDEYFGVLSGYAASLPRAI